MNIHYIFIGYNDIHSNHINNSSIDNQDHTFLQATGRRQRNNRIVCVYMYICIYLCVYIYIYIHIYVIVIVIHMRVHIYIYIYTCIIVIVMIGTLTLGKHP